MKLFFKFAIPFFISVGSSYQAVGDVFYPTSAYGRLLTPAESERDQKRYQEHLRNEELRADTRARQARQEDVIRGYARTLQVQQLNWCQDHLEHQMRVQRDENNKSIPQDTIEAANTLVNLSYENLKAIIQKQELKRPSELLFFSNCDLEFKGDSVFIHTTMFTNNDMNQGPQTQVAQGVCKTSLVAENIECSLK